MFITLNYPVPDRILPGIFLSHHSKGMPVLLGKGVNLGKQINPLALLSGQPAAAGRLHGHGSCQTISMGGNRTLVEPGLHDHPGIALIFAGMKEGQAICQQGLFFLFRNQT